MTNVAVVRYFVKKTLRLGSCVLEDRLVPVWMEKIGYKLY